MAGGGPGRVRRPATAAIDAVAASGTMRARGRTASLPTTHVPGEPLLDRAPRGMARRAPGGVPQTLSPALTPTQRRRRRRLDSAADEASESKMRPDETWPSQEDGVSGL